MSTPTAVVGIYGKVPAQADFVRANVGELTRLGLDRWFQEAHEALHREHGHVPEEPTFFALAPGGHRAVVLGAFAPGQDAVGRVFPLIVFAVLDGAATGMSSSFPLVPHAYARFFDGAAALLEGASALTSADLAARAQALNETLVAEPTADAVSLLRREQVAPLGLALGGLPHGAAYALRTLVTACDRARSAPAGSPGGVTTADAPAPTDAARVLWLELVRRRLDWRDAVPTYLWTRRDSARLLMALGPAPVSLLSFLANPRHKSGRFWPLRTDVDSALDTALAALTPEQRRVLESPGATLADVLAAFT